MFKKIRLLSSILVFASHNLAANDFVVDCTPEKIGRVVGIENGNALAVLTDSGILQSISKMPCKSPPSTDSALLPVTPMKRPIHLIGMNEGQSVKFSGVAITAEHCGSGYGICDSKTCGMGSTEGELSKGMNAKLFIAEQSGLSPVKLDAPGKIEDVSPKAWSALENELRKAMGLSGYGCSFETIKGVAGKRVRQGVRNINIGNNKKTKVAIVGVADTLSSDGRVAYGIKVLNPEGSSGKMIMICGTGEDLPGEFQNMETLGYGRYNLILISGSTDDHLLSLDSRGKVLSQLSFDNGRAACE